MLASFLVLLAGCANAPTVPPITKENDLIEGDAFQLHYPKDWKISSEEETNQSDQNITTYHFRHPQCRECDIDIEVISLLKNDRSLTQNIKEIATAKIRNLKNRFEHSGYRNFVFETTQGDFANRDATKCTVKGQKFSSTRRAVAYIVVNKKKYYTVSYQWFDGWNDAVKDRLKEIASSFKFVQ